MADEKKMTTEETENDKEKAKNTDSLDALAFNDDEEEYSETSDEAEFDSFMADFHQLIGKKRSEAATAKPEPCEEENPEDVLITLPKHPDKRKKERGEKKPIRSDDWDDEITLVPEEYDEDNEEEMHSVDLPEESTPSFDLGVEEENADDGFQLTMSFGPTVDGMAEPTEEEEPRESVYDPEKPRVMDWVFDIAEMFVFVLLAVILLTSFVFRHSIVEGNSMNATLEDGDHLIISDLFYTPDYGDIIVFEDYTTSLHKAVVKRVIALPGDTVEVRLDADGDVIVYLNGNLLEEQYAYNAKDCDIDTSSFNRPITLGEGEIFVMGDNRYHSLDSRAFSVGPISTDAILGKVVIRFFPFDKFGGVE